MRKTGIFERVRAAIPAPLDPQFKPAALVNRAYGEALREAGKSCRLHIALEREGGAVGRGDMDVFPPGSGYDQESLQIVERHIKFLLWAVGGWRLVVSGPEPICDFIRHEFAPGGSRRFDLDVMARAYDRAFEVRITEADKVPEASESAQAIGGHLDGCRIGFDLGASDYKLAAVVEGEPVYSEEIPWNPSVEKDPRYHYEHITSGLKKAAAHLPRVDAIGGSAAGIWVENQVKIASLFRAVPAEVFAREVKPMFLRIQREWGVPLVVANDGDVSALAGAMTLKKNALLGIAMGSSEAAGYLNRKGCITGQLNELAFTPVDFNPDAAVDPWSGDRGTGAMYFSQQAVNRLALAAGFEFAEEMPLPERLKMVQSKAAAGDARALEIFATIGVYFGYEVAHYAEYYDIEHVLMLGRVTSGRGGEVILEKAREVLRGEFPELNERITLHMPDEKSRRVGQAVAAASLPKLNSRT